LLDLGWRSRRGCDADGQRAGEIIGAATNLASGIAQQSRIGGILGSIGLRIARLAAARRQARWERVREFRPEANPVRAESVKALRQVVATERLGYDAPVPKPITDPFVLHACELLSCLGPCVAKRMFGGWGISVDGMNVALIAWDTLYLKTNADTEPTWLAAGCEPFIYEAKGKPMKLNYRTPPAEALESLALMAPWARLAMAAAVAARKPAPRRKPASRPK
jgi:DNA transformation protein and related proteins